MQSQKYEFIEVNKGIANRFPGYRIEINKKLRRPEYILLRREIEKHEMEHSEGFDLKDVWLDVRGFRHRLLYAKFVLTTPNSWYQFLPFYKASDGLIYWDLTLMLFYSVFITLVGALGWLFLPI